MDSKDWKRPIDWELERQVMIFCSDEAPEGLFELPSEFGRYYLTFPQRMDLTYSILIELLNEGLVTLEEYSSREARTPSRVIEKRILRRFSITITIGIPLDNQFIVSEQLEKESNI